MNGLDWCDVVFIVLLQVAMYAMFYFVGELAGIRKCRRIVDDFFASLEKKEDGKD